MRGQATCSTSKAQPRASAPVARPTTSKPSPRSMPRSSVCSATTEPTLARSRWRSSRARRAARAERQRRDERVRTHGGAILARSRLRLRHGSRSSRRRTANTSRSCRTRWRRSNRGTPKYSQKARSNPLRDIRAAAPLVPPVVDDARAVGQAEARAGRLTAVDEADERVGEADQQQRIPHALQLAQPRSRHRRADRRRRRNTPPRRWQRRRRASRSSDRAKDWACSARRRREHDEARPRPSDQHAALEVRQRRSVVDLGRARDAARGAPFPASCRW